jgi:hypothetical protein
MSNILTFLAGGIGLILMLGIGLAQMVIGYIGIEYHFGAGWAIGAVVLALMFRFSLPLTVGTFFGAMDVFGFSFIVAFANYITRAVINGSWSDCSWNSRVSILI